MTEHETEDEHELQKVDAILQRIIVACPIQPSDWIADAAMIELDPDQMVPDLICSSAMTWLRQSAKRLMGGIGAESDPEKMTDAELARHIALLRKQGEASFAHADRLRAYAVERGPTEGEPAPQSR